MWECMGNVWNKLFKIYYILLIGIKIKEQRQIIKTFIKKIIFIKYVLKNKTKLRVLYLIFNKINS